MRDKDAGRFAVDAPIELVDGDTRFSGADVCLSGVLSRMSPTVAAMGEVVPIELFREPGNWSLDGWSV
jgi:hypothetical protein